MTPAGAEKSHLRSATSHGLALRLAYSVLEMGRLVVVGRAVLMANISSPSNSVQNRFSRIRLSGLTTGMALVLIVQLVLYLSHRYQWFDFNRHKGHTVLITVAATMVLLAMLLGGVAISQLTKWKAQFGLGALMLLVPVAAIPLTWLAREIQQAQRQQKAVEAIKKTGAGVMYSSAPYPGDLSADRLETHWAYDFFADVIAVDCANSPLNDDDLKLLQALPRPAQLRELNLSNAKITNAGLERLASFPELVRLDLRDTRISDAGVEHLTILRHLQRLDVVDTWITAQGFRQLCDALPKCDKTWRQWKIRF